MHADLGTVLSWRNSPAVRAGSFDTHFISAAEHQAWFQRISRDPHCYWLIFARDEHSVGVGYFTNIDGASRIATWGFYKAPDAPPGTGTLLCSALLDYAFEHLPIDSLVGLVLTVNDVSIRIHEKLGFYRVESINDEAAGPDRPCIRFRIDRDQWRQKYPEKTRGEPSLRPFSDGAPV